MSHRCRQEHALILLLQALNLNVDLVALNSLHVAMGELEVRNCKKSVEERIYLP